MLTASALREMLDYDPDSGLFAWRHKTVGHRKDDVVGKIRRPKRGTPYLVVHISGQILFAHRLAWLWMTGEWPASEIDHINRNGLDNRWINLRPATRLENILYRNNLYSNNKSGEPGVHWHKTNQRWIAQFKRKHIGSFREKSEAIKAIRSVREKL